MSGGLESPPESSFCGRSNWDVAHDPEVDLIQGEWCFEYPIDWDRFLPVITVSGRKANNGPPPLSLIAHELGHAIGSLADEYTNVTPYLHFPSLETGSFLHVDPQAIRNDGTLGAVPFEQAGVPNVDREWAGPEELKWHRWLGTRSVVDSAEGAAYEDDVNYRPTADRCLMRVPVPANSFQLRYCAVCGEAMIRALYLHPDLAGSDSGLVRLGETFPEPVDRSPGQPWRMAISPYSSLPLETRYLVDTWDGSWWPGHQPVRTWAAPAWYGQLAPNIDGDHDTDGDPEDEWHLTLAASLLPSPPEVECTDPVTGEDYPFCPGAEYQLRLGVTDDGAFEGPESPMLLPEEGDPWYPAEQQYAVRTHEAHGALLLDIYWSGPEAWFLFSGYGHNEPWPPDDVDATAVAVSDLDGDGCPDTALGGALADVGPIPSEEPDRLDAGAVWIQLGGGGAGELRLRVCHLPRGGGPVRPHRADHLRGRGRRPRRLGAGRR